MCWRCCGPMLCNFLSYPPEVRKDYEMVLNNKGTAAPAHPSGLGYANSVCTRLRCRVRSIVGPACGQQGEPYNSQEYRARIDLRSFSTGI